MTKYVSFGSTESSDDLVPIIWSHKPTDQEVSDAYKEMYPEEYEEVGFVNHTTIKAEERS